MAYELLYAKVRGKQCILYVIVALGLAVSCAAETMTAARSRVDSSEKVETYNHGEEQNAVCFKLIPTGEPIRDEGIAKSLEVTAGGFFRAMRAVSFKEFRAGFCRTDGSLIPFREKVPDYCRAKLLSRGFIAEGADLSDLEIMEIQWAVSTDVGRASTFLLPHNTNSLAYTVTWIRTKKELGQSITKTLSISSTGEGLIGVKSSGYFDFGDVLENALEREGEVMCAIVQSSFTTMHQTPVPVMVRFFWSNITNSWIPQEYVQASARNPYVPLY